MNDASAWRLQLARHIAAAYRRHAHVAAIGVAGSVARGYADRYSDIEIFVYWRQRVTVEERAAIAQEVGAEQRRDYGWASEYGEWAEDYLVHGVKVDVTHFPVETVEQFLDDVLMRFDTAGFKSDQLAQLGALITLSGEEVIHGWQGRLATYPRGLTLAILREQIDFGPRSWVEMLASRGDLVALYRIYVTIFQRILRVLEALNGIYHRPGEKWLEQTIAEMRIAPPNLADRIGTILLSKPGEGVRQLHELIEETLSLVEEQVPEFDTGPTRARIAFVRPVWDEVPPGI